MTFQQDDNNMTMQYNHCHLEECDCFMGMTPDEWEAMYADFVARYPSEPASTESAVERMKRIDTLFKKLTSGEL